MILSHLERMKSGKQEFAAVVSNLNLKRTEIKFARVINIDNDTDITKTAALRLEFEM